MLKAKNTAEAVQEERKGERERKRPGQEGASGLSLEHKHTHNTVTRQACKLVRQTFNRL